jgi:SAM-dependent methyltransferase
MLARHRIKNICETHVAYRSSGDPPVIQLQMTPNVDQSSASVKRHPTNHLEPLGTETKQLHLGCFDAPAEGWVNTDITPHIWISRIPLAARVLHLAGKMSSERLAQHRNGVFHKISYLNVAKRFPYRSESFRAIFSCHMLEHLYPPVAAHCMRECHRVLRHDGVFRIVIPDLDRIVSRYDHQEPESFLQSIFEYGRGLEKNSHHWHYNFSSLKTAMLGVGFSRVERREFQVGDCPDVARLDRRPESLFVEAYK